jgi:hypothetical protein
VSHRAYRASTFRLTVLDRLYLASYTHKPNAQTPFPYTNKSSSKSPSKRSARSQSTTTAATPSLPPVYFSVDKHLLYNAFHADFGPLHIGHLYRFAVMLHEVLGDPEHEGRPVVFWCNADSRSMYTSNTYLLHSVTDCSPRSRKRCMHSCLLHDLDPELAAASSPGPHRPDGSPMHAIPRCRLQSS